VIIRAAYVCGSTEGEWYAFGLAAPDFGTAGDRRLTYAELTVPGYDGTVVVAIAVDAQLDTWRLGAPWASWIRGIGPGVSSAR
jgi:hypothetical protein